MTWTHSMDIIPEMELLQSFYIYFKNYTWQFYYTIIFSKFKTEKYFFHELSSKYKFFFCLLNMLYFINVFVLCITWYGFVFICVRASLYVLVVVTSLASICKYLRTDILSQADERMDRRMLRAARAHSTPRCWVAPLSRVHLLR